MPDVEPFYHKWIRRDHLIFEASTWIGTPFHAFSAIKGSGVDCVHLAACIYRETGFLHDFLPPRYHIGGGHHQDSSQIEAYISSIPNLPCVFESVDGLCDECARLLTSQLLPGDLLIFQIGRVTHHVGIVTTQPLFIHSMQGYGARLSFLTDATFGTRLRKIYRPLIPQITQHAAPRD